MVGEEVLFQSKGCEAAGKCSADTAPNTPVVPLPTGPPSSQNPNPFLLAAAGAKVNPLEEIQLKPPFELHTLTNPVPSPKLKLPAGATVAEESVAPAAADLPKVKPVPKQVALAHPPKLNPFLLAEAGAMVNPLEEIQLRPPSKLHTLTDPAPSPKLKLLLGSVVAEVAGVAVATVLSHQLVLLRKTPAVPSHLKPPLSVPPKLRPTLELPCSLPAGAWPLKKPGLLLVSAAWAAVEAGAGAAPELEKPPALAAAAAPLKPKPEALMLLPTASRLALSHAAHLRTSSLLTT